MNYIEIIRITEDSPQRSQCKITRLGLNEYKLSNAVRKCACTQGAYSMNYMIEAHDGVLHAGCLNAIGANPKREYYLNLHCNKDFEDRIKADLLAIRAGTRS